MDSIRKVLLIGVLVLTGITSVIAQKKMLTGTVRDQETSTGLPGATVSLLRAVTQGTTTDTNGNFELMVEEGDSLVVRFVGYTERIIHTSDSVALVVDLIPTSTNLTEVVIQAERLIADEFAIRKISKLQIYTNPNAKADPLLAVNATPSATPINESANISLRGSSPTETGIFLNNVPVNDAVRYSQLNGIGTFSIFNTALINQVQVYPGNPPLEFGNTTSGLISLSTDEVIPLEPIRTVSVSMANVGFYTQRKINTSSSLTAFCNYQPCVMIKWFNPSAMERLKQFNTVDFGFHYFARLGKRSIVKLLNYSNYETFQYFTVHPTYAGIFNQEKLRNYTIANFRYKLRQGEISFNQGISFSSARFLLSTIDANVRLNDYFSSLNYQFFGNKFELKTGLSYDSRNSNFEGTLPRYEYALGEDFPSDTVSSNRSVQVPEGYGYGKFTIHSKWITGVGFRFKPAVNNQDHFLSYQLNLNHKPSQNWNLILSAGRYNKMQLSESSMPDPYKITVEQYSFDVRHESGGWENNVSVYYKRGQRLETSNHVKGIELYSKLRLNHHWVLQLSLSSLNAKEITLKESISSPYDIGYYIRGSTEYKFGGTWTATIMFLLRQGSFYNPVIDASLNPALNVYEPVYGNQERLPDYNLIDLSISKLIAVGKKSSAVVFCSMSNLPDIRNVRDYTYNVDYTVKSEELFSLRTVYFGVVVNF